MNFNKTALASAVGATLAISGVASSVAYADGHAVSVYGRVNTAVNIRDLDGDTLDLTTLGLTEIDEDSTNVSNIVSRVGLKASAPINPDTTAYAQYEFSVNSDDEVGIGDGRQALVGVRGDFGAVQIGQMWSTFYNMVGTHLDPTVTLGAVLYSTVADFPYRTSNTIQYSNSFGNVNVSAEVRISDEDDPDESDGKDDNEKIGAADGNAIGVSFNATENLLLAVAVDSSSDGDLDDPLTLLEEDVDRDRVGFAAKWTAGNWWASLGIATHDADDRIEYTQTQIHAGMDFGDGLSGWIGIGQVENDIDSSISSDDPDDSKATTINITKRFGNSGFRVYYEAVFADDLFTVSVSDDEASVYDQDQHLFGARIDF